MWTVHALEDGQSMGRLMKRSRGRKLGRHGPGGIKPTTPATDFILDATEEATRGGQAGYTTST